MNDPTCRTPLSPASPLAPVGGSPVGSPGALSAARLRLGSLAVALTLGVSAMAADATQESAPPPTSTNPPQAAGAPKPAANAIGAGSTIQSGQSPGDPEEVRAEKEAVLQRRFVPDALTEAELDSIITRLGFSDEAKQNFLVTRDRYLQESRAARSEKARELVRLLPAAFKYDVHETEFTPIYTPELLTTLRLGSTIAKAVREAESALERDIGQLCDASHRNAWRRVRAGRNELLYGESTRLPGARVNLLEMLPKAGLGEGEFASLDLLLDRYADDYVKVLRERYDALQEIRTRRSETFVALGPEWRAGRTIAEALQVDREIARLETEEVRADIALRDLNAATIERIRKTLPPQPSRRVLVAWQSVVHPELFEEERLFRGVMEEFLAVQGIPADVQGAAIDRLIAFEEQLWPLGQQAVEVADNLVVATRLPPTDAAQVRIALDGQLHKLLMKRRKAVREAVTGLSASVPPEQTAFLAKLSDTLATFDAQDRAARFLMDQLASRERELQTLLAMGETPATAAEDAPPPGSAQPTTVPVGEPGSGQGDGTQPTDPQAEGAGGTSESPPPGPPSSATDRRENRDSRGSRRNAPRRP